MGYYSGTVASHAALRQAIVDACTAEGWAWISADEVLHKNGIVVRIALNTDSLGAYLVFFGRSALSGGTESFGCYFGSNLAQVTVDYPLAYWVFVFDQEVYVVINYSADYWQWAMFGRSKIPLPGTGNYVCTIGRAWSSSSYRDVRSIASINNPDFASFRNSASPFEHYWGNGDYEPVRLDHGLDSADWALGVGQTNGRDAWRGMNYTPNAFNGETVLFPIRAFKGLSGQLSLVVELEHARHCRIDHHAPGEIITLGADRWMVFPGFKKDLSNPWPTSPTTHTGGVGWAVRYEGP